jgi:hypothetical protein
MAMFETIKATAGWGSGRSLLSALAAVGRNFGLLEPAVTDSGAADYIPAIGDRMITRSRATAQTITIPTNANVALPIGVTLDVIQSGAGALTVVAAGGVTINKLAGKTLVLNGQWSVVRLRKISANVWVLTGDLV